MPPAVPVRQNALTDFHYHAYDYDPGGPAVPFAASAAVNPPGWQFHSLYRDLHDLVAAGAGIVPNLAVNPVGAQIAAAPLPGIQPIQTLALTLGPAANVVNAPSVVFTGGIHSDEWIGAEFVYLLAEYLVGHYRTAPQGRYQQTIKELVDSRRITIIPMLNPDGNYHTVFNPGGRTWRKNRRDLPATPAAWVQEVDPNAVVNPAPFQNVTAPPLAAQAQYDVPNYDPPPNAPVRQTRQLTNNQTGVDLNRNWNTTSWGYTGARYNPPNPPAFNNSGFDPSFGTYFGPRACSEIETGNTATALNNAGNPGGIATMIDYHANGQLILYPTETFRDNAVGLDYSALGQTLHVLVGTQGQLDYELGSPRELLKTDAPGTIIDRAAQQYHARAFAIELDPPRGTQNGHQLDETQICAVFEKNIRGALAALAAPARPGNWFTASLQAGQLAATMVQFLTWDVYGRGNRLPA